VVADSEGAAGEAGRELDDEGGDHSGGLEVAAGLLEEQLVELGVDVLGIGAEALGCCGDQVAQGTVHLGLFMDTRDGSIWFECRCHSQIEPARS
jgi:hypothetical protein